MIKVFGIGNILLCDDGIGVRVVESLLSDISLLSPAVVGIIGETDCFFCLDQIGENDCVIIIDSTYLGSPPGTVSFFPFSECKRFVTSAQSVHEMSLLKMLLIEYPNIKGYLVGIEIDKIDFSLELSTLLQNNFQAICKEILSFLESVVRTYA